MITTCLHGTAMVLALFAALSVAAGCELATGHLMAEAQSTGDWQREYADGDIRHLQIENVNGAIQVTPGEGRSIVVSVEKKAKAGSDEAAARLLESIDIEESRQGDRLSLKTRVPRSGIFNRGSTEVAYRVTLPAGVALDTETVNGSVTATDVSERFKASTVNGRIVARGLSGPVDVSTVNGSVEVSLHRVEGTGVSIETINGSIELDLPVTASASVKASCVNGRVSADNLPLRSDDERRRRLAGDLNGGGPSISLSTVNGSVTLVGRSGG
jgi:hypothetical protein